MIYIMIFCSLWLPFCLIVNGILSSMFSVTPWRLKLKNDKLKNRKDPIYNIYESAKYFYIAKYEQSWEISLWWILFRCISPFPVEVYRWDYVSVGSYYVPNAELKDKGITEWTLDDVKQFWERRYAVEMAVTNNNQSILNSEKDALKRLNSEFVSNYTHVLKDHDTLYDDILADNGL